jgi:hypothetical protein
MVAWVPGQPIEVCDLDRFAEEVDRRLPDFKSPDDLKGWLDHNRKALDVFWAKRKSDALELKKHIETRLKVLKAEAVK